MSSSMYSRLDIFELNFYFCSFQMNFILFIRACCVLLKYKKSGYVCFQVLNNNFRNILQENIQFKKHFLNLNLYFFRFCLILFFNLISLLPFHYTITAQFIFTFIIAFILFRTLTLHGMCQHNVKFLNIFLPAGIPVLLNRYIIRIEIISYRSRLFSLSGRLFRNLVAGHVLLFILSTRRLRIFNFYSIGSVLRVVVVGVIGLIFCLEIVIRVLQAYVFILLICIFTDNILTVSH
jgi:ATP synthase subunit 6